VESEERQATKKTHGAKISGWGDRTNNRKTLGKRQDSFVPHVVRGRKGGSKKNGSSSSSREGGRLNRDKRYSEHREKGVGGEHAQGQQSNLKKQD